MFVDYETTLEASVPENIVIRNGKKYGYNTVSYDYLACSTQVDHSSIRSQYSYVFFILLSFFSCEKFEKTFVTCNV